MSEVTLITPTKDRPVAFALCEKWMARQSFSGSIRWIVADNGERPVKVTLGQEVVRVQPTHLEPRESFRANLLAALDRITDDRYVLFIEDDDWYSRDYIANMMMLFESGDYRLVGQTRPHYYHLPFSLYRVHDWVKRHASLCQTGIRWDMLGVVRTHLGGPTPQQLDGHLWKRSGIRPQYKSLQIPDVAPWCIGMKGLPGQHGLGIHHTQEELKGYLSDPDGIMLAQWVGAKDAACYNGLV